VLALDAALVGDGADDILRHHAMGAADIDGEDLQVAHQSTSRWLEMLENLYLIFRIYPFGALQIRAVKKESKHYHLDWTAVSEMGLRFENLVAFHLLKLCHYLSDTQGYRTDFYY